MAAAESLLRGGRARRGGSLWVEGQPGIGKTSYLDAIVELAGDCTVVRGVGREAEADLAWAVLAQVIGPLIAEGKADGLRPVRRAALLGALALDEPDGDIEPYAVLTGAQDVLQAAAAEKPVVVVVDDAQWVDDPSYLAVRFLAARCDDQAIAVVVATRPDPERTLPAPDIELAPLSRTDAHGLLADLGVGSPTVRDRLVDELAGVPLLLRAAVDALDPSVRSGASPLPDTLPVPRSALRWAQGRVATASEAAQSALLVASILPDRDVATVQRALAAFGAPPSALEEAERDGLLAVDDGLVAFHHPTFRAAGVAAVGPALRRSAHAAVAQVIVDRATACWHRGLSLSAPDEQTAGELEADAGAGARRGAHVAAARSLELAARLSPEPTAAARRLRLAAAAIAEHGRPDAAEALLARAEAAGGDPREGWHRRRLHLTIAVQAGADPQVDGFRALAEEIAPDEPALAAEVLLDGLPPLVRAMRVEDCRDLAVEAGVLAARAGDERLARRADVVHGAVLSFVADADGPARLARYREVLAVEGAARAGSFLVEVVAPCLTFFERGPEVDGLFAVIEEDLRARGAAGSLVQVLAARAMACHRRDLPRAAALAQEAVDLAEVIDQPAIAFMAASELASATALIGDRDRCVAAVGRLMDTGMPRLRQTARTSLGVLCLAEGDLEGALTVFEAQRDEIGLGDGAVRWEIDWCEALVLARRPEEAAAVLEEIVSTDQALLGAGGFTRIRGLLAEELGAAEELFAAARQWFRLVGNQTGEGRTELVWGERLRRARQRSAARDHLVRALELFEGTGAEVWAVRARRELDAAGGRRTEAAVGAEALTAQELAIVRLAVAGATNQEIGSTVFLSPRTVETHLSSVFRKLGVRNRRELVALALDEPALRG